MTGNTALNNEIITLLMKGYDPQYFQKYREYTKMIFGKEPPTCGCEAQRLFNNLKNYFKIE